jgi:hypothetical protein
LLVWTGVRLSPTPHEVQLPYGCKQEKSIKFT